MSNILTFCNVAGEWNLLADFFLAPSKNCATGAASLANNAAMTDDTEAWVKILVRIDKRLFPVVRSEALSCN